MAVEHVALLRFKRAGASVFAGGHDHGVKHPARLHLGRVVGIPTAELLFEEQLDQAVVLACGKREDDLIEFVGGVGIALHAECDHLSVLEVVVEVWGQFRTGGKFGDQRNGVVFGVIAAIRGDARNGALILFELLLDDGPFLVVGDGGQVDAGQATIGGHDERFLVVCRRENVRVAFFAHSAIGIDDIAFGEKRAIEHEQRLARGGVAVLVGDLEAQIVDLRGVRCAHAAVLS